MNGYLDNVDVNNVLLYEDELYRFSKSTFFEKIFHYHLRFNLISDVLKFLSLGYSEGFVVNMNN